MSGFKRNSPLAGAVGPEMLSLVGLLYVVRSTTSHLSPLHAKVCVPFVLSVFSYWVSSLHSILLGSAAAAASYCSAVQS